GRCSLCCLSSPRSGRRTVFFFFSSRRRHTRCYRDWSSDVCSSDLGLTGLAAPTGGVCGRASRLTRPAIAPGRAKRPTGLRGAPAGGSSGLLVGKPLADGSVEIELVGPGVFEDADEHAG